ncbi:unannotated protein [freshwater metagenome]|uniref:Unannotated protein n=1 Tax=freshwater metagenome TaxID=449393 RepID=A0A6J7XUM9_9ZZZZ|nr:TetR family transcriptional regulator [Actinomycetota bacterium]
MSPKKKPSPALGRKSAYVARNRAHILKATIEVLATDGQHPAVEHVSERAEIAMSTIYKHFKNRDELFAAAMGAAMADWEEWVFSKLAHIPDPLEQLVFPMRMIARLKSTHPTYAKLIENNLALSATQLPFVAGFPKHVHELISAGVLKMDHPDIRIQDFQGLLFSLVVNQSTNPAAKVEDADLAIEIGLSLLNISAAKARKISHAKLPDLSDN